MICRALTGQPKDEVLSRDSESFVASERISLIARGSYLAKGSDEIRGSGYVVESLEAALWAFANADTFEEAILLAANLGDDADTTAAVCGQLAGAYYGEGGIPQHWRKRLSMESEIATLADQLYGNAS